MGTRQALRALPAAGAVAMMTVATAATTVFPCISPNGQKILQDTPCRPPAPSVSAPVESPPCVLAADELRQAVRRETQFLRRFSTEESHRWAQLRQLEAVVVKLRSANARLDELQPERLNIVNERQFHPEGRLPTAWQVRAEANDGQFNALDDIYRHLEQEIAGIVSRYECERATFAMLWGGAPPGSSGCRPSAC